jgi:hypothetical protein
MNHHGTTIKFTAFVHIPVTAFAHAQTCGGYVFSELRHASSIITLLSGTGYDNVVP